MTTPNPIRAAFPLLARHHGSERFVYLDSAATCLMPSSVIDAVRDFSRNYPGSVHRGSHRLAREATTLYEGVRARVRDFLGAAELAEIIFVRGATQGLNLLARSLGETNLEEGDQVVVSALEHHANLIPWQQACQRHRAQLRILPLDDRGDIDLAAAAQILNARTRIVALTHISNVLGTINPLESLIAMANQVGAITVIDGAQSAGHLPVNLQELNCDFFVASGHKMLGPTGVGILYGRRSALERIRPIETGGAMVTDVTWSEASFAELPYRLEPGTPPAAQVVGLGAAIDFLNLHGLQTLARIEAELTEYALDGLKAIEAVRIVGAPRQRGPLISFLVDGLHSYDLSELLDHQGIALRAGTHCAQPLIHQLGLDSTVRASLAFYNDRDDIDRFLEALRHALTFA